MCVWSLYSMWYNCNTEATEHSSSLHTFAYDTFNISLFERSHSLLIRIMYLYALSIDNCGLSGPLHIASLYLNSSISIYICFLPFYFLVIIFFFLCFCCLWLIQEFCWRRISSYCCLRCDLDYFSVHAHTLMDYNSLY